MTAQDTLAALPCACATLRRAARAITQLYDAEMRAAGLKSTQFTILQVLAAKGEIRQGGLAEFLVLDATTLTRTMKLLEREGWITGRPGKDRRERYWNLTQAGRNRLATAKPRWEHAQRRFRQAMLDLDWEQFMQVTNAATEAAQREHDTTTGTSHRKEAPPER